MRGILDIRVQKTFLIALVLKVLSSGLGWYLQKPWSLGFWIPLSIMGLYVVLGIKRRDSDITDEKFADTCYYLGFIFTITSIIFSLFDLPNIGTQIQNIAVRFGAAMVSTVVGLGVRVYLVGFRKDVADAIRDAEDALLDSTRSFTEQLALALERLRDFESQVDLAARSSVERVNLQVEALSKNHSERLGAFFEDLTARNQDAFTQALEEVKNASLRLSNSMDGYSHGVRANLSSIESKVTAFAEAVTERLRTTTFPDDYFAQHLQAPLLQLQHAATEVSGQTRKTAEEVGTSAAALSGALKSLRTKSTQAESSLDTVLKLTEQQQAVLGAAAGQAGLLEQLMAQLNRFDAALSNTIVEVAASCSASKELTANVRSVVTAGAEARVNMEGWMETVVAELGSNAAATSTLAGKLEATAGSFDKIAVKLVDSANASAQVASTLEGGAGKHEKVSEVLAAAALADKKNTETLIGLGEKAGTALTKVDQTVTLLQDVVAKLGNLETNLVAQSRELKGMADGFHRAQTAPVNYVPHSTLTPGARPGIAIATTHPVPHSLPGAIPAGTNHVAPPAALGLAHIGVPGLGARSSFTSPVNPVSPTSEN